MKCISIATLLLATTFSALSNAAPTNTWPPQGTYESKSKNDWVSFIQRIQPDKASVSVSYIKAAKPHEPGTCPSRKEYVMMRDDRIIKLDRKPDQVKQAYDGLLKVAQNASELRILKGSKRQITFPANRLRILQNGAFFLYHISNSKTGQQAWFEIFEDVKSSPEFRYQIRYAQELKAQASTTELPAVPYEYSPEYHAVYKSLESPSALSRSIVESLRQANHKQNERDREDLTQWVGWASVADIEPLLELAKTIHPSNAWPEPSLPLLPESTFFTDKEGVRLLLYRTSGRHIQVYDHPYQATQPIQNSVVLSIDSCWFASLASEDGSSPYNKGVSYFGSDHLPTRIARVEIDPKIIEHLKYYAQKGNKLEKQQAVRLLAAFAKGPANAQPESKTQSSDEAPLVGIALLRWHAIRILEDLETTAAKQPKQPWQRLRLDIERRLTAIAQGPNSTSQSAARRVLDQIKQRKMPKSQLN